MTPSERLAVVVEDAIERTAPLSPLDVILVFDAVVDAIAEQCILALVAHGWTQERAITALGVRRVERIAS